MGFELTEKFGIDNVIAELDKRRIQRTATDDIFIVTWQVR